jgi:recombination protein RecT
VQLIKVDAKAAFLGRMLKDNDRFLMASMPQGVDKLRLKALAFNAIAFNSDLIECLDTKTGQLSIVAGVMESLKLGIELHSSLGEGWLIPFNDNRAGGKVATLIVGYKGMRNIAHRSGYVLDLNAYAVYEGDDFDFGYGDSPFIKHKPARNPTGTPRKPEELIATYMAARLPRGGKQIRVLYREEIEAHRARSRAAQAKTSPWHTDYEAMAVKTAVRVGWALLPKTTDMGRVERLQNQEDNGITERDFAEALAGIALPPELQGEKTEGTRLEELTRSLREGGAPAGAVTPGPVPPGRLEFCPTCTLPLEQSPVGLRCAKCDVVYNEA